MTLTAFLLHRLGMISRNTLHDIMQMDVAIWALIWGVAQMLPESWGGF